MAKASIKRKRVLTSVLVGAKVGDAGAKLVVKERLYSFRTFASLRELSASFDTSDVNQPVEIIGFHLAISTMYFSKSV